MTKSAMPKEKRKAPALTPRVFATQYEALLLQGLLKPVDLEITDKGEDDLTDALRELLGKKNWSKVDLVRVSAMTFTMALIAEVTGEDYEEDDEGEDEEDDHGDND